MRCREALEMLGAHAAGELGPEKRETLERHLAGCPGCQTEAEGLARMEEALWTLGAVERSPELTLDMHRRIAEREAGGLRWAWAGAGLAAVAAALAASLFIVHPPQRIPRAAPGMQQRSQVAAPSAVPAPSPPPPAVVQAAVEQPAAPHAPPPAPRRIVRRPASPVTLAAEEHRPDTRPIPKAEAIPPQAIPAHADDETQGVILLLGRPEPVRPSSGYYVVVSLPNGQKSIRAQSVQRDRAGRPEALRITYERIPSESQTPHQGG